MTETCANCKHWRLTHIEGEAGYGECHGAPPIQIQPPAIGRIQRLAAWIITPDHESCGGFTPQPRPADPIEDTPEGVATAENPPVDMPAPAGAPAPPSSIPEPAVLGGLGDQTLRDRQTRKGKANAKA